MRILVVTQYFWPEIFRINDLVIGLKERGHEIIVLTGKPNYPSGSFFEGYSFFGKSTDTWNGIKIYRSGLIPRGRGTGIRLMLNYLSFALLSTFKALMVSERPDCIFVYEPSPITVGLPAILAKRKFKVPIYFWVQDIWPHSLTSAGNINNSFVIGLVDNITRWIYKKCDKILIQSEAFRSIIEKQGVSSEKIIYFPNWSEDYYIPLEKQDAYRSYFSGKFNLVFAGNIGEAQDFNTLIQTAAIVNKSLPELHWVILGRGRMLEEAKRRIKALNLENCFKFAGSFPSEEMPGFFSHADALIVSLKRDPIFSITIPSKIQSYLACGKPILTSLDGEGSRIITEAQAGISSPASSPEILSHAILQFISLPESVRTEMGNSARKYYERVFNRSILIDKLVSIIE